MRITCIAMAIAIGPVCFTAMFLRPANVQAAGVPQIVRQKVAAQYSCEGACYDDFMACMKPFATTPAYAQPQLSKVCTSGRERCLARCPRR